jgi:formylglycine-generating enzyme required for sulfatase activity
MLLRTGNVAVLLAVLSVIGCAQVKPAEEFAFQTEEQRLDAEIAPDADAAQLDATDDAADAPDAADVQDGADAADAVDTADAADAVDVLDADDTADVADVVDSSDAVDAGDAGDDADAPDAVDLCADVTCDDANPCTTDSCVGGACKNLAFTGGTCDLDKCHINGFCSGGTCNQAENVKCDDSNDCTADSCDNTSGCVHILLNNSAACVGDLCMTGQVCKLGVCQGGAVKPACNDSQVCTDDSCDPLTGCVFSPNAKACDDGEACTGADVCAGGKCEGVSKFVDLGYATGGNIHPVKILAFPDGFGLLSDIPDLKSGAIWFLRTDLAGATVWSHDFGFAEIAHDAAVLPDGIALLSGSAVLRTLNTTGDLVWQQQFGTGNEGFALAIDSGIALAGDTEAPAGDSDGWLAHVDLSGGATWTATFGGAGADGFYGAAVSNSGFALAGVTNSSGAGGSDFWLVRTDASGVKLWEKTYGGAGDDTAWSVVALPDGYLLAGDTASKGAGGVDAWLVRTDLNGAKLWDHTYGGKQFDSALQVLAVPGGFAFSGTTASTGAGGNEMWLVRTDDFGNKMFGFPYGGAGDDGGSHLALLPNGFGLFGYTNSKTPGTKQAWLLTTDLFGNTSCAKSTVCIGKTFADCSDGSPCTTDLCDAAHSGCFHGAPAAFACDDGLKCTGPDVCTSNVCGGPALNCDDSNVCTADSCDAEFGCVNEALDGGTCGGSLCAIAGTCAGGACGGTTPVNCDDSKPCTDDSCALGVGCQHSNNNANPCNDGNPCTVNDNCVSGGCVGSLNACDDGNTCTNDSCDATKGGCVHANNSGSCGSDACLTNQLCGGGTCGGGTPKNCDDGNGCTTDFCTAGNCAHGLLPNSTPCSTDTACTVGEVCTGGVCGDGGPREFDATFGTSGLDNGYGITALSDGFAFVGSGPTIPSGTWVVRTDLQGTKVWEQTYQILSGGSTQGNAIIGISDGLVICGNATISGVDPQARVIRTDVNGGVVWDKTFGSSATEDCSGVVANSDGGFAFVGNQIGSDADVFAGRLKSDGTTMWTKSYGGTGSQAAYGIASTDTGFVFAGTNNAKGAGGTDFWLVATDLNGNALWDQTYGTTAADSANAVVALPDGYAIAGRTGNSGFAFYLVRTDLNGVKIWDKTYTTTSGSIAYSLAALTDGFALTGSAGASGAEQFWLVRTDAQGNTMWDKKYGGSGSDSGYGIAAVSDGFALIGSTDSKGAGLLDSWLVRTDSFGNASCTASGACDGKTEFGCDDGNPCTADFCSSGLCGHNALPVGAECDKHGFCDVTEACVAQMASIPAGTFWMGCNSVKDSNCSVDENPQHKVKLSAYAMDLTETTVGQYKVCVDAGVCTVPSAIQATQYATYPGLTNNPVNYVSWTQAQTFCKWRGPEFDLPTEAQWEMAARGRCEENGSTAGDSACATAMRTYPWGEETADCSWAVMRASTDGCGTNATWAVGSKTAGDSPFGVHDLAGNVAEWIRDSYALYGAAATVDPIGQVGGGTQIGRGGAFFTAAQADMRSVRRSSDTPTLYGFRCVRSP